MDKGQISSIEGYKTYAADVDIILNKIQATENSIIIKLQPTINSIKLKIEQKEFDAAYLLIDQLVEKHNIDSISSLVSDLRMEVKKKKIFG
jgi:hypothetical protein